SMITGCGDDGSSRLDHASGEAGPVDAGKMLMVRSRDAASEASDARPDASVDAKPISPETAHSTQPPMARLRPAREKDAQHAPALRRKARYRRHHAQLAQRRLGARVSRNQLREMTAHIQPGP